MIPATARRAAVFVDRDGVLNELVPDPDSGTSESPLRTADVRLLPGVVDALKNLRRAGYLLVGVTNQPAAAKGRLSVEEIMAVHHRVIVLLAEHDLTLDDWRICLHHPQGTVAGLAGACDCRKPSPGMLLAAASRLSAELSRSWMVGDTDADMEAGQAAGCRTVLIEQAASAHKRSAAVSPTFLAGDLAAASSLILGADSAGP